MALFAIAQGLLFGLGEPTASFWTQMADAFTRVNLWVMLVNLLPIPPLDGAEAWRLFGLLWARRKRVATLKKTAMLMQARAGAKLRIEIMEGARKEARALQAMDEVDVLERGVTPEVEAVLDRVRAIAAEEGDREVALRAAKQGRVK